LRLFSFGGYGLALAALALVVFGAYDSYPYHAIFFEIEIRFVHCLIEVAIRTLPQLKYISF